MNQSTFQYPDNDADTLQSPPPPSIVFNYKRVLARTIKFWYLVVAFVLLGLSLAFLVNRYTTRIYPVKASILIREAQDNVGGQFLYNNPLVNPYRNYFNEMLILKSFPLFKKVVDDLNFGVSFYREGTIKTTEYYDSNFPVSIKVLNSNNKPYGRSLGLTVENEHTFSLEYISEDDKVKGEVFKNLSFNDTINLNGYSFFVESKHATAELQGKYYVVEFTDPAIVAKRYVSKLSTAWAQQGASVVTLEITGPQPSKDIDFINKYIAVYQQYDIDRKNAIAERSIEFLDEQLKEIGDSLRILESELETFKRNNVVTNLTEESSRLFNKLEKLEGERIQLQLLTNYYDYLETYLKNTDIANQIIPPSVVGINDNILTSLIQRLIDAQYQLLEAGTSERDTENPLIIAGVDRVKGLKKNILEGMISVRATQQMNDRLLQKQIAEIKRGLSQLPDSESHLVNLQRSYTLSENLFKFLQQKRAEAAISRASTTTDVHIVNPPSAGGVITPKKGINYGIGFLAGLFIPLLGFVLMELLDTNVQGKEDIENATSIPIIGGIGHNDSENNLIVFETPKSAIAESFRALRSNLNYFTEGKDKKIFLITSSISGEGKSFTSLNLATVFSLASKRTLIIGADLRRPKIFEDFKLNNDNGLSQYLSGLISFEEVVQKTAIPNLDFVSGGPVPPNPSELLMTTRMDECMRLALEQYDFVILDTAPLGLVTDAFSLVKYADHVVFIIRQGYTPREAIAQINESYVSGKIANVSILFNDIRNHGMGYGYGSHYSYGYNYGYGYGYGYYMGRKKDKSGGYYQKS